MATPAELLKDAGLTDDEVAATLASFSTDPRVAKAFEAGTLRQSDYSRNMDALKFEKQTLQANWNTANAEYVKMQTTLSSTQAEKDAAAAKLAEAEAKLAAAPAFDPTKIVTLDQLAERSIRDAAGQTAFLGDILDIADEHEALFGKRISKKELMQDAILAGKDPRVAWTEKYGVVAKREEVTAAERAAHEATIREDERKKVLTEMTTPGSRPLAASEQPFYVPAGSDGSEKNPWDDVGPSAEEKDLVSALATAGR